MFHVFRSRVSIGTVYLAHPRAHCKRNLARARAWRGGVVLWRGHAFTGYAVQSTSKQAVASIFASGSTVAGR